MVGACLLLLFISLISLITATPDHPILFPSARIASYVLVLSLGSGIHGHVWHVTSSTNEHYAMKCMANKSIYDAEVRILNQLGDNPFTIRLIEAGIVIPAHYCFVMEYAQGTLNPPTPTRQGFRDQLKKTGWVFYQLLKGLEYLHQQHIVHMDVANRNVVFVDGVPKWTDFGLARVDTEAGWLDVRRLGHTMHGHVQALGKVGRVPKRLRRLIRRLRRAGPNNRASHYLQDDVWKSLLTPVAKLTRTQVMLGGSLASNTTESIVY